MQTRRMLLEPNAREDDWAALHGAPVNDPPVDPWKNPDRGVEVAHASL